MTKNIFIEGIPGSGKSTLLNELSKRLPEHHPYHEGDICPVELAWCSYMTKEDFQETLEKFPDLNEEIISWSVMEDGYYIVAYTRIMAERREFYEYMEGFEIYNGRVPFRTFHDTIMKRYATLSDEKHLFECSFFQNSIESMMLFYCMKDEEIIAFYREAYEILKNKGFRMIYLDSDNIREDVLQIKKERADENGNEMWFPLMMNFLKESPYGKERNYQDFEDVVHHFERRRALEHRIIAGVIGEDVTILTAKNYDISSLV